MKISTKGRYGLRALIDLALHSNGELVALKNIAERQGISEPYLEQVFSTLRKAGIVKSQKGSQGGYVLGKDIQNINVGQVLRILEGDLFPINDEIDNVIDGVIYEEVWNIMNESINHIVDNISLDILVNKCKKVLEFKDPPMFYI